MKEIIIQKIIKLKKIVFYFNIKHKTSFKINYESQSKSKNEFE